jgi:hypothetical protein
MKEYDINSHEKVMNDLNYFQYLFMLHDAEEILKIIDFCKFVL